MLSFGETSVPYLGLLLTDLTVAFYNVLRGEKSSCDSAVSHDLPQFVLPVYILTLIIRGLQNNITNFSTGQRYLSLHSGMAQEEVAV